MTKSATIRWIAVPIRETITAFKFRTKKNVDNKIEKAAIAMFNLNVTKPGPSYLNSKVDISNQTFRF